MKKMKAAFLITLISGLLALMGCTSGKDAEENASPPSGNASAAAESAGNIAEAVLSASDRIPDNFPKDIPIPEEPLTLASMKHDGSITVSFDVKQSFDKTLNIYKEYFKSAGYQVGSETLFEDSYTGTGTLGGKQLLVMISMTTADSELASVSLTYQSKNK